MVRIAGLPFGPQVGRNPSPTWTAASTWPSRSSRRNSAWSRVALKSPARMRGGSAGGGSTDRSARHWATRSWDDIGTGDRGCTQTRSTGPPVGSSSRAVGWAIELGPSAIPSPSGNRE